MGLAAPSYTYGCAQAKELAELGNCYSRTAFGEPIRPPLRQLDTVRRTISGSGNLDLVAQATFIINQSAGC